MPIVQQGDLLVPTGWKESNSPVYVVTYYRVCTELLSFI